MHTAVHRFAIVLTNYAHGHLKSWSNCVSQVTMYVLSLPWSFLPSVLYSVLYMHVLWRLALSCTVDFPPQQLPQIIIHIHPDYFSLLIIILGLLALFYLDMLHTLWMHAASSEQVKLRRKRVIAIMRELPHEVLWCNLMQIIYHIIVIVWSHSRWKCYIFPWKI